MKAIVAVNRNWGIGYKDKLLYRIPEDMKFFRSMTTDKVIVVGRKTLMTFPGAKPLKNRTNIVLTRDNDFEAEGAVVCRSIQELMTELKKYNTDVAIAEQVYTIDQEPFIWEKFLNTFKKGLSRRQTIAVTVTLGTLSVGRVMVSFGLMHDVLLGC